MTALDAAIQIRSLRAQLNVLEARLRTAPEPQRHTLADLRGMLQRESQTSDEEIAAVKFHPKQEPRK
jgi:hypothetical protein